MAIERRQDLEQRHSQQPRPDLESYSSPWMILTCIIAQVLIILGFQIKDFGRGETGAQIHGESFDEQQSFLRWMVLTNAYALLAIAVAFAVPYVRSGSRRMMLWGAGVLLAPLGGVLQAFSAGPEQFATGRILTGTACGIIVGMPFIQQVVESDPLDRVRSILPQIGVHCCATAIATWIFVSGASDFHYFHPLPILVCFHALPGVLAFFYILAPLKAVRRSDILYGVRGDQEKKHDQNQRAPEEASNSVTKRSLFRVLMGYFCILLYACSTGLKFYQTLPEIDIFSLTTIGGLVRTSLSAVFYTCTLALALPMMNKTGHSGMLLLSCVGQLLSVTPLRVMDSKFLLQRSTPPFAVVVFILIFIGYFGFGVGMIWFFVVRLNSQSMHLTGMYIATAIVLLSYSGLLFTAYYVEFLQGWPSALALANIIVALITFLFPSNHGGRSSDRGDRVLESGRPIEATTNEGVAVGA